MGSENEHPPQDTNFAVSDLEVESVLGIGSFGIVEHVNARRTDFHGGFLRHTG